MRLAAAFALGVLAGLLVGLWLIARSIATPETASVPRDQYLEDLAGTIPPWARPDRPLTLPPGLAKMPSAGQNR